MPWPTPSDIVMTIFIAAGATVDISVYTDIVRLERN